MSLGWRHLALAAVLALAAHLHFTAALKTVVDQPIRGDAADYISYAYNLEHSGVYSRYQTWHPAYQAGPPQPDALRSPGYPLLLQALMDGAPTPAFLLRVTLWQALIAVLSVWLSFLFFRRFLGFGYALAGAALIAMTPHLVTSTTYVLSETWFMLWLLLGMLAAVCGTASEEKPRLGWLLAAGLALGFAALVRPTLQYLPLLWAPALWWLYRKVGGARAAGAFALGFVLCFAPWIVRNEITLGVSGDPHLTKWILVEGTYPEFRFEDRPETFGFPAVWDPDAPAHAASVGTAVRHIVDEFGAHPARMAWWYFVEKPVYLFAWDQIAGEGDVFVFKCLESPYFDRVEFRATRAVMLALHVPLMLAGGLAILLAFWPRFRAAVPAEARAALLLGAMVMLYIVALHVVAAPYPRYSVPFRPLTVLGALVVVRWVRVEWRARRSSQNGSQLSNSSSNTRSRSDA
jgi:4-amino-4-deoxy-L-arabinose transferase-like glycosyltransferase